MVCASCKCNIKPNTRKSDQRDKKWTITQFSHSILIATIQMVVNDASVQLSKYKVYLFSVNANQD